mmetsp:Transcript_164690/g.528339  ORF Transcript_164690/g.528339 Transcript_164690/m.528339 type:complete len:276 (-) Transcript_164690:485-1312(-)
MPMVSINFTIACCPPLLPQLRSWKVSSSKYISHGSASHLRNIATSSRGHLLNGSPSPTARISCRSVPGEGSHRYVDHEPPVCARGAALAARACGGKHRGGPRWRIGSRTPRSSGPWRQLKVLFFSALAAWPGCPGEQSLNRSGTDVKLLWRLLRPSSHVRCNPDACVTTKRLSGLHCLRPLLASTSCLLISSDPQPLRWSIRHVDHESVVFGRVYPPIFGVYPHVKTSSTLERDIRPSTASQDGFTAGLISPLLVLLINKPIDPDTRAVRRWRPS